MKKLFFLLIATNGMLSATAQMKDSTRKQYLPDAQMQKWAIDVNLLGGALTQNLTTANSIGNYQNALSDANLGKLKFTNGTSFGFDAQLGYFFGASNHFGIGAGIMYLSQMGDATLDQFHVQFQSTDGYNNISRQVITATQPIKEKLSITNIDIPLVLKYKDRFSKRFGFTVDAGILYNVQEKNAYNTNAAFNYEEIVQNVKTADGNYITLYDNSLTPANTDLQITQAQYIKTHPGYTNAQLQQYFATEAGKGYVVALGNTPNNKTGNASYTNGSIGFLIQPSLNYYLSDNVALNVGAYYIYQTFNNAPTNNYQLTDKPGAYNSVLNNVSKSVNQSYGANIGVRFLFGKHAAQPVITGEDAIDPTGCGLTDGAIVLHGLTPGKYATVNYTVNNKNGVYTGTIEPNGTVKVPELGAGNYTNLSATMGKHHLDGTPINLVNPQMNISAYSTNPTKATGCDGSITITGLRAGKNVTVSYNVNGSPKQPYTGTVSSNNSVTLTGLCAGSYSQIVVSMNGCTANASDIMLTAPQPPPAPVAPAGTGQGLADISQPILFEVGKTKIHPSSYSTLERAIVEVQKQDNLYIIVEGHTDNTGTDAINDRLSQKRADAVKEYLMKRGVRGDRIVSIGHGSRMPIATNGTPEGRAENRRVVMTLNIRTK